MFEDQEQSLPSPKKGRRREASQIVPEQAVGAYHSYWPFALAVALIVLFAGIIIHPIIMSIGAVLTVVAIIGWGLERR
jgi:Cytochrome c oxidase subunit IV